MASRETLENLRNKAVGISRQPAPASQAKNTINSIDEINARLEQQYSSAVGGIGLNPGNDFKFDSDIRDVLKYDTLYKYLCLSDWIKDGGSKSHLYARMNGECSLTHDKERLITICNVLSLFDKRSLESLESKRTIAIHGVTSCLSYSGGLEYNDYVIYKLPNERSINNIDKHTWLILLRAGEPIEFSNIEYLKAQCILEIVYDNLSGKK